MDLMSIGGYAMLSAIRFFLILILLVLSFPLESIASSTCDVALFGTRERVENWYKFTSFTIDGKKIPIFGQRDIYVFNNLNNGDKFYLLLGMGQKKQIKLKCGENSKTYLKIDREDYSFVHLNEEQAKKKFTKYKYIKKLNFDGSEYFVDQKTIIEKNNVFADIFEIPSKKHLAYKKEIKVENINSPQNRNAIAVIIGSKNYSKENKNVPDVDYALNDADQIYQYVTQNLGYREGNIIYLKDATQADLVSVFGNKDNHKGQLFSWIRPNESDVFVYYSGHGAPGLSDGQGYLLPVNANPNTVELNGYPIETLFANLGKLPARETTVVIDACFSGGSQAGSVVKNASSISLRRASATATLPKANILTASDVTEVASWDEEAQLGLFTRHFLEGVTGTADKEAFGNGDGTVTLGELKRYLDSEVTYMARRLYMREQHPQISGSSENVMAEIRH